MTLSRPDTEAAYRRHRALHDAGDWPGLAELFAPDASYADPFFGEIEGREAIRAFLTKSMAGLDDWTFPIAWTAIDEGRVVISWLNRLPEQRRGGGHFEFPGMSTITYAPDGQIASQVDLYDRARALQVIAEARVPAVEHAVVGLQKIARPLIMGAHWWVTQRSARRR